MATPTTFGSEFLVNTITLNAQDEPVVKALANGTFIVAWTDASGLGGDSFDRGIEAQLFNADGSKLGSQFLVNAVTTADQSGPDIGAFSDGSFVISWLHDPDPADDQGFARARIFNTDGSSNTPQVQFIPSAGSPERAPRLAVLNDGTVVGTVSTAGTLAGDGIAVQNEGNFSAISFNPPGNQIEPRIAALSDGGYVVVWWNSDGPDTSLTGQKFNADGTTAGSLFAIETTTPGLQGEPEVSALPGGGFVVVWVDDPGPGPSDVVVRARVFPATGAANPDFVISGAPAGFITAPAVTTLADGRLLAAWQVGGIIRAQAFTSDGALDGSQFVVNSTLTGFQPLATVSLTTLSDGRVVVVWSDVSESGGDISDVAVRGQILDPGGTVTAAPTITPPDFNGDGTSDVLWRHNSGSVSEWLMNGRPDRQQSRRGDARSRVAFPGSPATSMATAAATSCGATTTARSCSGRWTARRSCPINRSPTIGNDWHNEGAGDFNGDGSADVALAQRQRPGRALDDEWRADHQQSVGRNGRRQLALPGIAGCERRRQERRAVARRQRSGRALDDERRADRDQSVGRQPRTRLEYRRAPATSTATARTTCCYATTAAKSSSGR